MIADPDASRHDCHRRSRASGDDVRMCGRFVSSSSAEDIAKYFDVREVSEQAVAHEVDYNTAPTSDVLTVYEDGSTRRLDTFRWGLVPKWAKDLRIGSRLINARMESVADKPAFRSAFRRRRCIVPADGFYEWTKPPGADRERQRGKALPWPERPAANGGMSGEYRSERRPNGVRSKQPWFIHRPDGEPYAFAGLWERWRGSPSVTGGGGASEGSADDAGTGSPEGEVEVRSVTIITCPANSKMAAVHDRMPVMLPAGAWAEWLDPDVQDPSELARLLVPAPPELIDIREVGIEVNDARNKGPGLVEAVGSS
jgi:putative SOS response-associated peptidase YedK